MPRGPKGEKHPADVVGNAVHVMRIATGEIDDLTTYDGKNGGAGAHGRKGAGGGIRHFRHFDVQDFYFV
jgi:hypothetical protein